eukprot:scaffold1138_cov128-Cylindrotheca_fusiformis.AAC.36
MLMPIGIYSIGRESPDALQRKLRRDDHGLAGVAISEIKGIPDYYSFWAHTSFLPCNDAGNVTEIERGITYGNIGWEYDTSYQFRFEISSNRLLAYVNGQLELNVTGSFDISGNFCYYNLSQDNVQYSGLTRQTASPSARPSESPSTSPTSIPSQSPSTPPSEPPILDANDSSPPICDVESVTEDGTSIILRAFDAASRIIAVTLDPPSADISLTYDIAQQTDDTAMEIGLSIDYLSESTDFRSSKVVVTNEGGLFCSFPAVGSILDDDCGQNENCLPDDPIEFPMPSRTSPLVPLFDFQNATMLAEPVFGRIDFNGTTLRYVPTWVGIEYDAVAIESRTIFGDTIFFSATYNGLNKTVEIQIDILGSEDVEYFVDDTLEDDDDAPDNDDDFRLRRRLRREALPIEYNHIVTQGVFGSGKNAYKIDGIDKDFLNRIESKQFGLLMLREDHRGKNAILKPKELNQLWVNWVEDFRSKNGRLPVKNEVLTTGFDHITKEHPKGVAMMKAGIPNPDYSYNQWNDAKYREYKRRSLAELEAKARSHAKLTNPCIVGTRSSRRLNPCKALKRASKLPVVGRFSGLGVLANEVFLEGRPIGEAAKEFGLDAIPVWGEIRGAYSLAQDLGLFSRFGIKVDEDNLESLVWKSLWSSHGIKETLGLFDFGVSNVHPGSKCYDYHGACDMIFLRSAVMEIHIRTKSRGTWSSVSGVAIRIGNDTLEFDDNSVYYLNGELLATNVTSVTLGGLFPFSRMPSPYDSIRLPGGQFIRLSGNINLQVHGHGSNFRDANGMSGKWDRSELIGRDGLSKFENTTDFAREWEVSASKGDPQLFREAAQGSCREPPTRPNPDAAALEAARNACAKIVDRVYKENCVFDVSTTGDSSFAENVIYTQPLQPGGICASASEDCELRGGSCVWRCDTATSNCLPNLCNLVQSVETFETDSEIAESIVDGCSCELPFVSEATASPSYAPSATPSYSPSTTPSYAPSFAASSAPSCAPSSTASRFPTSTPTASSSHFPSTSIPISASYFPAFWSGHLCSFLIVVLSLQLFLI